MVDPQPRELLGFVCADSDAPDAQEDDPPEDPVTDDEQQEQSYSDVSPSLREQISSLSEGDLDALWENALSFRDCVSEDDDADDDADDDDQGQRLRHLAWMYAKKHGRAPDTAEVERIRQEWITSKKVDKILSEAFGSGGDVDADSVPTCAFSEVEGEGGEKGVAVVMRLGYSFSEITTWLHGVYSSTDAALADLRKSGHVK